MEPQLIEFFALRDERGVFLKPYVDKKLQNLMLPIKETYFSFSQVNTFRGLHYQIPPHEQSKLVVCLTGTITDYCVDLRKNSLNYGSTYTFQLEADINKAVYVPRGFAHGIHATQDCLVANFCDGEYSPENERQLHPSLAVCKSILADLILSEKDATAPRSLP